MHVSKTASSRRPLIAAALSVAFLAAALAFVPGAGSARAAIDHAKYRPLGDITKVIDFGVLRPLLERGEVCQISYRKDGSFKHFSIFSLADAPPTKLHYVLGHPAEYPDFVNNVKKSKVKNISRDGKTFDVHYEIEIPLINMSGVNHEKIIPEGIEIWGTAGSLENGHWIWRFIPVDGGTKTIIAYTGYTDPSSAGIILRKLVKSNPTLEAGTNLAGGIVLVRAVKYRAMALAGRPMPKKKKRTKMAALHSILAGPRKVDYKALIPMLAHGQMSLIESGSDGSLIQGSMMSLVSAPLEKLYSVVSAPERFGDFVPNVAKVTISREDASGRFLDWVIDTPIVNVKFSNKFRGWPPKRVHMVATGGAVTVGAWGWELRSVSPTQSFAVYYNYADLRGAGFAIRKMIDIDPSFEHGLNVANSLTMLLAVKGRAEEL